MPSTVGFRALVEASSGHPFRGFDEGLAAAWENYKPRLRDHALGLLRLGDWLEGEIGSGAILKRMVEAIEIQDSHLNLTNNLVFWQNRFGHANRDHRAMLEAASNPVLRGGVEGLLFGLYRGADDEVVTFDGLVDVTGGKYPLLAYLFCLKDMDRYMPFRPTGFDHTFRALGIEFTTLRQCSWANYARFNATLDGLRPLIAHAAGLDTVQLVRAQQLTRQVRELFRPPARVFGHPREHAAGKQFHVFGEQAGHQPVVEVPPPSADRSANSETGMLAMATGNPARTVDLFIRGGIAGAEPAGNMRGG